MLLIYFKVALSSVSAWSDIKWPQNTIFLKHKLKIKAEKLECTNTKAIKAGIKINKEKPICVRAVTMSLSEDVSDEEGFHPWTRQGIACLAAFLFILSHHEWFGLDVFHTLFQVLVGTVFTCTASDRRIRKTDCEHGMLPDQLPTTDARASEASCTAPYPGARPPDKHGISVSELFYGWTTNWVPRALSGHFSDLILPHPVRPF